MKVLIAVAVSLVCGVFGVHSDEVKTVSVMEGDLVTLHTNLSELQTDDHILWMFGPQETRLAEIYRQNITIYEINDKDFKNRLQISGQTGSLTIANVRLTDSGLYKLQTGNTSTQSNKTFSLTGYAHLPIPIIIRDTSQCFSHSRCVLVCSAVSVTRVTLSWYKEHSLISSISASDLNIRLSLPLEVEYQDNSTYSCVVNNPLRNQTHHRRIADVCKPCLKSTLYYFFAAFLLIPALICAVCCWCFCCRKNKPILLFPL